MKSWFFLNPSKCAIVQISILKINKRNNTSNLWAITFEAYNLKNKLVLDKEK